MNKLKKILLSILGEKRYLALLSASFQRLFKMGLMGNDYQDVYFLKSFIEEGFFCVDIGAHLGYYTFELSRLVKNSGKIFAIEPMSKFNNTIASGLAKKNIGNVVLYQYALGGDTDYVEMGIPEVAGNKKFAYARVMESNTYLQYIESEKVKNETGDNLFTGLERLDFIKCDVEGLEVAVFLSMMKVVEKFQPILLCELGDKSERIQLFEMLAPLGYECYLLDQKKLIAMDVNGDQKPISHNHYFIPAKQKERLKNCISA